jgi:hypothetical protein
VLKSKSYKNSISQMLNRALFLVILAVALTEDPLAAAMPDTFIATGNMTMPRHVHTATLLENGKVLVAGGFGARDEILASAELYDPTTGTFTATGNVQRTGERGMISARRSHTATLLNNGMVLIAGGIGSNTIGGILAGAELYDPDTGSFFRTGDMTVPRYYHTATLLQNGTVLIVGGSDTTKPPSYALATAEIYDPSTGKFTATGSLSAGWCGPTANLLADGKVLIASPTLKMPTGSTTFAELYDPSTGTFTSSSPTSPTCPFYYHASAVLRNGKVLITGGGEVDCCNTVLIGSELYDPGTGKFAVTGDLNIGRLLHTATLLPDGSVLIVGGSTKSPTPSAELYDPVTGSFGYAASMISSRFGHTATLLTDGAVLLTGGIGASVLSSAERYYPEKRYAPTLSLDFTQYCAANIWALNVSNAPPNAPVRLLGSSNGQSWKVADWRKTDATGALEEKGTHTAGAIGNHTLRVEVGGVVSNSVSFVVSSCSR